MKCKQRLNYVIPTEATHGERSGGIA